VGLSQSAKETFYGGCHGEVYFMNGSLKTLDESAIAPPRDGGAAVPTVEAVRPYLAGYAFVNGFHPFRNTVATRSSHARARSPVPECSSKTSSNRSPDSVAPRAAETDPVAAKE